MGSESWFFHLLRRKHKTGYKNSLEGNHNLCCRLFHVLPTTFIAKEGELLCIFPLPPYPECFLLLPGILVMTQIITQSSMDVVSMYCREDPIGLFSQFACLHPWVTEGAIRVNAVYHISYTQHIDSHLHSMQLLMF